MKNIIVSGIIASTLIQSSTAISANKAVCIKTRIRGNNVQCIYSVTGNTTGYHLYALSDMPYALCSKAKCSLTNNKSKYAICICPIHGTEKQAPWTRASVGPHALIRSASITRKGRLISVVSNFSLANLTNTGLNHNVCAFSEPTAWANCFGVRCTVLSSGEARCVCPVVKTKVFVTQGIKNQAECILPNNMVWSATTPQQGKNDMAIIKDTYKRFYPDSPFAK